MHRNRRSFLHLGLLGLAAGLTTRPAWAGAPVARAATVLGEAFLVFSASEARLRPGAWLRPGAVLRTARSARLEIRFLDGSLLTVGAETRLEIDRWTPPGLGEGVGLVTLIEGILRLAVAESAGWSSIAVQTETAVASVRGTDWLVEAGPQGTAVFVASGRVAVTSKAGGSVVLRAGEGSDVPPGGPPTPPRTWAAARRDAALARLALP